MKIVSVIESILCFYLRETHVCLTVARIPLITTHPSKLELAVPEAVSVVPDPSPPSLLLRIVSHIEHVLALTKTREPTTTAVAIPEPVAETTSVTLYGPNQTCVIPDEKTVDELLRHVWSDPLPHPISIQLVVVSTEDLGFRPDEDITYPDILARVDSSSRFEPCPDELCCVAHELPFLHPEIFTVMHPVQSPTSGIWHMLSLRNNGTGPTPIAHAVSPWKSESVWHQKKLLCKLRQ